MLPDLPAHAPDCRPLEGFCAPDCERYDAIMADAMWGRPARPDVDSITYRWDVDESDGRGCLVAVLVSAFIEGIVILALLWWLT